MDPLSITASLLAITTAAIQSIKSLRETIKRFNDRDKTLRRLQNELEHLTNILDTLKQAASTEQPMLTLVAGPVERCCEVCRDFEQSIKAFREKSKMGFLDWTKMEFKRGDMNEFIDTISGYKSTISIALATVTLHVSKVSEQVLQQYNEMILDTAHDLQLHLRRIDEKMTQLSSGNNNTSDTSIDLEDEREVTKQCLRICEDARSYIEALSDQEASILPGAPQLSAGGKTFEAQSQTRRVLDGTRDRLAETIDLIQKRIQSLVQSDSPGKDSERCQLQADLDISKQCLEVCNIAAEASCQKVFKIGEVVLDGDCDQVVVNTLADLFDVQKALSKGTGAQLVASVNGEELRHLVECRYSSRFGAVSGDSGHVEVGTSSSPAVPGAQRSKQAFAPQPGNHEQSPGPRTRPTRPFPNETRKRQTDDVCG